jgi:hypothetical protein
MAAKRAVPSGIPGDRIGARCDTAVPIAPAIHQ